jgi:DNA-binding GntR family transcriptional regulator
MLVRAKPGILSEINVIAGERRRMSLFSLQPTAGPSAQRAHVAIVSAIANRDAMGAAAAMANHRESTLAAWRKALAELPSLPR